MTIMTGDSAQLMQYTKFQQKSYNTYTSMQSNPACVLTKTELAITPKIASIGQKQSRSNYSLISSIWLLICSYSQYYPYSITSPFPTNYVVILSLVTREPHFTLQVKLAHRLLIIYIYLLPFVLDLSPV